MFSATGNLLPGSRARPDLVNLASCQYNAVDNAQEESGASICSISITTINCPLNKAGYVPGLSTVTGLARALLGIVHTIVHLAAAIFDLQNRALHLEEAALGGKNIVRGLIEMTPIIGNIAVGIFDMKRVEKFVNSARDTVRADPRLYHDQATLFIYGEEAGRMPLSEFNASLRELSRIPTPRDLRRIIPSGT